MNKDEKIDYLNRVVKYLNLSAVCDLYNKENATNKIDYNNMRVVLKKQSVSRLSEEKLDSFIHFFHNYLIPSVFEHNTQVHTAAKKETTKKITKKIQELNDYIVEVIKNEI